MTDCFVAAPFTYPLHLREQIEEELLTAVQTAGQHFQCARGEQERAVAREEYFRALSAFSEFLLGRDEA